MSDSSHQGIGGLSGALLGVSVIAIAFRFVARYQQKAAPLADDYLTIPSLICLTGLAALVFFGISQGFVGYAEPHDKAAVAAVSVEMAKTYIAFDAIATLTIGFTKLSALFFYRRIFVVAGHGGWLNIATIVTIAIVALWTLGFFLLNMFGCGTHLWAIWTPGQSGQCWVLYPYFEGVAISDFIMDIWIICLPVPNIWKLQTTIRRKFAITGVLLLAIVGLAASAVRMVTYIQLVSAGHAANAQDIYLADTRLAFYVILEAGMNLIAVNLPSLWYFVAGVSPEGIVRSVRSILSLRSPRGSQTSLRSTGSKRKGQNPAKNHPRASIDTGSSQAELAGLHGAQVAFPEGKSVEAYAMTSLPDGKEYGPDDRPPLKDGIRVTRTLDRKEEHV